MNHNEIYTYTKVDLINSIQTIEYPKGNTNKICKMDNVSAPLHICNNIVDGFISFTNNVTLYDNYSFTTNIGTIITSNGTLVFTVNYNTDNSGFLPKNNTVQTKPTFKSGLYEKYNDINITIIALNDNNNRILNISY